MKPIPKSDVISPRGGRPADVHDMMSSTELQMLFPAKQQTSQNQIQTATEKQTKNNPRLQLKQD